jgi:transcriptional regulator with XRE-family HTH domain
VDIRQCLGRNIRRLRDAKGLSQEKFAFEARIHRTYISDIERGARNPTITIVQRLADALGVTASDLLTGVESSANQSGGG